MTAYSGLLAVPLAYGLARAFGRGQRGGAVWGPLLAAALLAVSYWEVSFSRIAFRAIHLVPFSLLTMWLFWRAVQQPAPRRFVFAGLALGLTQYTYVSARLLPLVFVALAGLHFGLTWLVERRPWRAALRQPVVAGSLLALVTAALVFAPLGAYFALHPQQLLARSSGLSIFNPHPVMPDPAATPPTLLDNLVAVTRMFIDRGDSNPFHNLPGRTAADGLGLVGLWVGVGLAGWRWRQTRHQLLLLWFGVMLLPTLLSIEAPHFLRAIGAIPPLCLLAGEGLLALGRWLTRRRAWFGPALVAGVLVVSGGLTYRDYFVRWPLEPRLAEAGVAGRYALAQAALALSATGDVAVPLELYTHPTALFVFESVFPHLTPIDEAPASDRPVTLVAPLGAKLGSLVVLRREPGRPPLALLTRPLEPEAAAQLDQWPADSTVPDAFGHAAGVVKAGVEQLIPATARPAQPLDLTFAGLLRLDGYDLQAARIGPDTRLEVNLYWHSLRWAPDDYVGVLQLHAANGENLAQQDGQLGGGRYVTAYWRPGDSLIDTYALTLPVGLLPGKYPVVFGVYEGGTVARLPASDSAGNSTDLVTLQTITIPDPDLDPAAIPNRQAITAGDPALARLIGYALGPAVPGQAVAVTLYWEGLAPMPQDYTVFVHLLDAQGNAIAGQDGQPLDGRAPTSWWAPSEVFRDVHLVDLPADLPPGPLVVQVGLYYWATGERLPLFDATAQRLPDDLWQLPAALDVIAAGP